MNKLVIFIRSIARNLGLTKALSAFRSTRVYEDRFSEALRSEIRESDIVWDVGANIGLYTFEFASLVGKTGAVVAFEPNKECYDQIQKRIQHDDVVNVQLIPAGLGSATESAFMQVGQSAMSVDSRVVDASESTNESIRIQLYSGDDVVSNLSVPSPNVMKIDVEGFELDCLKGMSKLLQDHAFRSVFIEVHFRILELRGMKYASIDIETLLKANGFNKVQWLDASHLFAKK